MIDMHMHTTYSDGTDSLKELLANCEKAGLSVIAVTDHNSVGAYREMETFDRRTLYTGKIVPGCEFTTGFEHKLIEVLGLGIDWRAAEAYLSAFYAPDKETERYGILYDRLTAALDGAGCVYDKERVVKREDVKEFFEISFYRELMRHEEENRRAVREPIWNSWSDFYRIGLTNPASALYMDHTEFKPEIGELIRMIHAAGGKAFLAHPFAYKYDDTEDFMERIFAGTELDGTECHYTTFTPAQTGWCLSFAKEHRLLVSGGSDYHAKNKPDHALGTGRGSLHMEEDMIADWDVPFLDD